MTEQRAVNLEAPAYMRAAAKRGVELHEEGLSGDGVVPQTVEDARKMASGTVTAEKWRKIGPWIARHLVDLDAVEGDEITPGLVAHLLWGSGPSKSDARRAMEYANDVVGRLDEEEERVAMDDNEETTTDEVTMRELPDNYRPADSDGVPEGASCGSCMHRAEDGMCMRFEAMCEVDYYCDAYEAQATEEVEEEEVVASDMEESDESASVRNRWVVTTNNKRSIAYSNLEIRAEGEGSTLVGYAAVFDSPSEPLPWTEFVRRGAFAKTINDGADVRLLVDHEGVPLARTKSGTLRIKEDDKGLRVEADLDEANPDAARVMSALRRGDVSQMSFAFEPVKDSWSGDKKTRELKEVKLYDVSVVTYPAYEETMVQLRNAQANNTNTTTVKQSSLALRRAQIAIQRTSRAVQQPTEQVTE
jgi:HK97 family phage prohead protease